ncbi:MAG TPA: Wadjet anti-phage system protein JetD domain-containing protein [Desulfosporosinus sp.]|nr:Wadjet anti-phage system protein JetD domain-containing protein [Desulfosporosinus sp.]
MISLYEKKILNRLLDKYEGSKSFIGNNKVNQRFSVKLPTLFPQYTDHANYELFQSVNEAIDVLARKKLIVAKANSTRVCSEVSLKIEGIDDAYNYLNRVQKNYINYSVRQVLDAYKDRNEILNRFCTAQTERILANRPIQFFSGELGEFENILIAVDELLRIGSETFVRDFSVRIFKDSKTFERIRSKVENLLFEYGDFPEKNQLLENLNLVKNPTYVNFKGAGSLELCGQMIDLSQLRSDLAISSSMLPDIDTIKITGRAVLTIENLTSFHTTDCSDMFVIYLGGFHNRVRREFIKKIFQQNPGVCFYHFGDIDAGGFYILEHLKQTGIEFQPYKMDLETLKKYQEYSKKLTDHDRDRLIKLRGSQYEEVISYMLENDCKLEQEAIIL